MNKYIKEKVIGKGTFGTVWLVKSTVNQNDYVLKDINFNKMTDDERQRAMTEVMILAKCRHNNIIGYENSTFNYQTGSLYILMQYADGGDLMTAIKRQKGVPFQESNVISWFIQICLALHYLHYNNVLHRDLKSKNIFLTKNKVIKVGDFGIATILKNSEDSATTKMGTPCCISPEVCMKLTYNSKSDMWALGVVLFEMAALEYPFVASDFGQLASLILKCQRKNLPNWCGQVIQELVDDLIKLDPVQRLSADEILAKPSLQPYLVRFSSNTKIPHLSKIRNAQILQKKDSIKRASEKNFGLEATKPKFSSTGQLHMHSKSPNSQQIDFKITKTSIKNGNEIQYRPNVAKDNKSQIILDATYIIANSFQNEVEFPSKTQKVEDVRPSVVKPKQIECIKESPIEKGEQKSRKKVQTNLRKTSISTSSSTCSSSNGATKSPCQHSQCHHCMIDMLWKNRIQGCQKTSMNKEEYCDLKHTLLSIFKKEKFYKIYHSLLNDWNDIGNLEISSKSYTKTLTYEEMQHLPLMMQLIQLDMLKNSLGNEENLVAL